MGQSVPWEPRVDRRISPYTRGLFSTAPVQMFSRPLQPVAALPPAVAVTIPVVAPSSAGGSTPLPSRATSDSTTACFPVPSDAARSASTAAADAELLPAAAAAADDGPAGSDAAEDSNGSAKATSATASGPAERGPGGTAAGASGERLSEGVGQRDLGCWLCRPPKPRESLL